MEAGCCHCSGDWNSAAGEINLHLLQHYHRSVQLCLWGLCSLWHNRPVTFIISCLSMRFYLFILLTCFNFFYDYFFRLIAGLQWKVGWKADYFPLSCIPSCVDPVSLTLKDLTWSQPPCFRITGSSTPPPIHQLALRHSGCLFPTLFCTFVSDSLLVH